MSGGLTGIEAAIRTCKVNTGDADRIQSDRFIGSADKKTCPLFAGQDLIGRAVAPDSFMTKSPGCNTASDRIYVENTVFRPHYYEYTTLNPYGPITDESIEGFGYGQQSSGFIRAPYGYDQKECDMNIPMEGCRASSYSIDDIALGELPPDLRFNSMQPGPFNNMSTWDLQMVPREYGMPYSQLYGQDAEDRRIKQALWVRSKTLGQNPRFDPNWGRFPYSTVDGM